MAVAMFHARALKWGYAGVLETTVLQGVGGNQGRTAGATWGEASVGWACVVGWLAGNGAVCGQLKVPIALGAHPLVECENSAL
jgi:hypothetical protein